MKTMSFDATYSDSIIESPDLPADEPDLASLYDDEEDDTAVVDAPNSTRKAKRPAGRLTSAQIRRVLSQVESIDALDGDTRGLLAATLNTSAKTPDLVVATLGNTRAAKNAVNELLSIASTSNPFERMVSATAVAADRDAVRRVWGLLTELGHAEGGIPAKDVVAGARIAELTDALTEDNLGALRSLIEVLG